MLVEDQDLGQSVLVCQQHLFSPLVCHHQGHCHIKTSLCTILYSLPDFWKLNNALVNSGLFVSFRFPSMVDIYKSPCLQKKPAFPLLHLIQTLPLQPFKSFYSVPFPGFVVYLFWGGCHFLKLKFWGVYCCSMEIYLWTVYLSSATSLLVLAIVKTCFYNSVWGCLPACVSVTGLLVLMRVFLYLGKSLGLSLFCKVENGKIRNNT